MRAVAAAVTIALGTALIGAAPPPGALRGYTIAGSERERAVEAQFADIPSAQSALDVAAAVAAEPHYAGTPGDRALALVMRDRLRADGIDAELEAFTAVVDTPRRLALELLPPAGASPGSPERTARNAHRSAGHVLDLAEAPEPTDGATAARGVGIPFNSGSADGDVTAPLVFVDRGGDADYAALAEAHIDVAGAVVLVRYGAEFRGLPAERAQAHGAAGVLFYSDPKDDGAARGVVYPGGPWRPATAVQRGTVGTGIHIPALPISAKNATLLLDSLRGEPGPPSWNGALPVTYVLARGPGRVHLVVKLDRQNRTLWNTVGVIPGRRGDQSVLLGAHRDAWVYGVGDNGAGVITMLEVARGLGFLLAGGWRPERTIVIAGWDGEEIGLLGSRAYTARHLTELRRGGVAYLNADENITGPTFGAAAVAAIAPVVVEATHRVPDPATASATIYDRWAAQTPGVTPRVENPGGGSDHQSFLAAAGVPVANLALSGPFGVYHSSYDTLRYATTMSDPGFALHRTMAQLYGTVALRLADAAIPPYTFGGYVDVLRAGIAQLTAQAAREHQRIDATALARAVDGLAYAAIRVDNLIAHPATDISGREVRAAHLLDSLVYGANGYSERLFPELVMAVDAHDPAAIEAAVRRTADAVALASRTLAG